MSVTQSSCLLFSESRLGAVPSLSGPYSRGTWTVDNHEMSVTEEIRG